MLRLPSRQLVAATILVLAGLSGPAVSAKSADPSAAPDRAKAAKPAAKPACYTDAEFEAEQAIRLHTELMVIGLTCASAPTAGGPSLFAQYKEFTLRHRDAIVKWEQTLVGHFKRTQRGNATRAFDSFRTRLANETSQRAIALTPTVFCGAHMPLVAQVGAMAAPELRQLAANGFRIAAAPRCQVKPRLAMAAPVPGANAAPTR